MTFLDDVADDLSAFFEDLAVDATWDSTTFKVIFHNAYEAATLFGSDIASKNPYVEVKDSDIVGIVQGDSFTVEGVAYKIKDPPQPDGMGITVLILSKS